MITVMLILTLAALILGGALFASPFVAFAILGDEMSERVERWINAFYITGLILLLSTIIFGVITIIMALAQG